MERRLRLKAPPFSFFAFLIAAFLAMTSNAFGQTNAASEDALLAQFSELSAGVEIDMADLGIAVADLERVEVFAQGARIILNDGHSEQELAPQGATFWRGHLQGNTNSLVTLTVEDGGAVYGVVNDGERVWNVSRTGSVAALEAMEVDTSAIPDFDCAVDGLEVPDDLLDGLGLTLESVTPKELSAGQYYQATIAVDTDYAFYSVLGGATAATNYVGSLINYVSGIYEDEIEVKLAVGQVYLYSSPSDPWSGTSTLARLNEFVSYWRSNRTSITRTLAHFLSGESLGGGIAYLDTLCNNQFGYGVSANLTGSTTSGGGIAWDGVVVAHELGHNFSSPHTHCYGNIGGNSNPVDGCWSSETSSGSNTCYSGTPALPGVNSLTGGTPGARDGTIMSYCHQRSGGISNIAATFGDTNRGIQANRVITRMKARAAAVATANPSCMPIVGGNDPKITSPAAGSTLSGASQTFSWTSNGTAVLQYHLYAGSSQGGANYYTASQGTNTSGTVTGLPTDGSTVHVRFWWRTSSGWDYEDYQYRAATGGGSDPAITSPAAGSTLSGASQTFSWTSNGTAVLQYYLYAGSSQGGANYYTASQGTNTSGTVTGLPTDGSTVHVRFWWRTSSGWDYQDYQYRASNR
jgi:hypothetical protein